MLKDGTYVHAERKEDEEEINSQEYLYRETCRRFEEKQAKQKVMRENREKSSKKPASKKKTNSTKTKK